MKSANFDQMGLYTLASLYLDTFQEYSTRKVYEPDKKLHSAILTYVLGQKSEKLFFETVGKCYTIRQ